MDPHISIVTLGVDDLDDATTFYRDGLNLPEYDWEGPITFFDLDGSWLALFDRESLAEDATVDGAGSGFDGGTLAHNTGSEAAVDEVLAEAKTAGAEIVKPASETDWGGYSGYFEDLDGHLWEVAHNPHFPEN